MSILGEASVSEVADLVKAKDYAVAQLRAAWEAYAPIWAQNDPKALADFNTDIQALSDRYAAARIPAMAAIGVAGFTPLVSNDYIAAGAEWDGILKALCKNWVSKGGPGSYCNGRSKGDYQDLATRIQAVSKQAIDDSQMPQPGEGSDADLEMFKKADVVLRGISVLPPAPGQFPWMRVAVGAGIGMATGIYLAPLWALKLAMGGGVTGWLTTSPWNKLLK